MNLMTCRRLTLASVCSLALLALPVLSVARADEKEDAQMILGEAKNKIESDTEGKKSIEPALETYKGYKASADATAQEYFDLLAAEVPITKEDAEAIEYYLDDAKKKRTLGLLHIDLAVTALDAAVAAYNVADEAFKQEKWGQCSEYSNKAISNCTEVYIALCDAYNYLADSGMSVGAAQEIINFYKE